MNEKNEWIVVIPLVLVFMALGAAMVYFGYYVYRDTQTIRSKGVQTTGTVLRFRRIKPLRAGEGETGSMAVPIVQFRTQDGRTIVTEGHTDSSSLFQNMCSSGKKVEIIYYPTNPHHALINTFAEIWFGPLMLWVIGLGFIFVPPFTMYRHYSRQGR